MVLLTPALAEEWLATAEHPEALDLFKMQDMAGAMLFDGWDYRRDQPPLVFIRGRLTNGKHRCAAMAWVGDCLTHRGPNADPTLNLYPGIEVPRLDIDP
jgi:hypothetical protein